MRHIIEYMYLGTCAFRGLFGWVFEFCISIATPDDGSDLKLLTELCFGQALTEALMGSVSKPRSRSPTSFLKDPKVLETA